MKSFILIILLVCSSIPACFGGYCNESDLVVATGVSAGWFDRLQNLVGSIHFWSPTVKLEIYDLGMTMKQRQEVLSWKNAVLLNLQEYLQHEEYQIHRLWTYAFKPVIIHEALQRHQCVLWLDSGVEARRDLRETLFSIIDTDGFWLTTAVLPFPFVLKTPVSALKQINETYDLDTYMQGDAKWMVAATHVGFSREHFIYQDVFLPWLKCCMNFSCIQPEPHLDRNNYLQDQTILNALLYQPGGFAEKFNSTFTLSKKKRSERDPYCIVHLEEKYWANALPSARSLEKITKDETQFNDIVIFTRRAHKPYPYVKYLQIDNKELNSTLLNWNQTVIQWEERPREILSTDCEILKKQYEVAVCAVFANEGPFLQEWIEFHRLMGVSHFFLYATQVTKSWRDLLHPYIQDNIVTVSHYYKNFSVPGATYEHCLSEHGGQAHWILFLDVNEYAMVKSPYNTFQEVLKEYENEPALILPKKTFCNSNFKDETTDFILQNYKYIPCQNTTCPLEYLKTNMILNTARIQLEHCVFATPKGHFHNCFGNESSKYLESGVESGNFKFYTITPPEPVKDELTRPIFSNFYLQNNETLVPSFQKIQLNHYMTQCYKGDWTFRSGNSDLSNQTYCAGLDLMCTATDTSAKPILSKIQRMLAEDNKTLAPKKEITDEDIGINTLSSKRQLEFLYKYQNVSDAIEWAQSEIDRLNVHQVVAYQIKLYTPWLLSVNRHRNLSVYVDARTQPKSVYLPNYLRVENKLVHNRKFEKHGYDALLIEYEDLKHMHLEQVEDFPLVGNSTYFVVFSLWHQFDCNETMNILSRLMLKSQMVHCDYKGGTFAVSEKNIKKMLWQYDPPGWRSTKNKIWIYDQIFNMRGVAYFGMETHDRLFHGLWSVLFSEVLELLQKGEFNVVRIPFSASIPLGDLYPRKETKDWYGHWTEFQGLTCLEILDIVIDKLADVGIMVILDMHTLASDKMPLWYSNSFTESDFTKAWDIMLARYGHKWNLLGIDILNEPSTPSTWGIGSTSVNWKACAERTVEFLAAKHPQYKGLFFVQAVDSPEYELWKVLPKYPLKLNDSTLYERTVYTVHLYGPDVNASLAEFSNPTKSWLTLWETYFSFVQHINESVVLGEWGGKYLPGTLDYTYQNLFVEWLVKNDIRDAIYWAVNPNSADTGGILNSDWLSLHPEKMALVSKLEPDPSKVFYDKNSGKYFYSLNEETYRPHRKPAKKNEFMEEEAKAAGKKSANTPKNIEQSMQQTLDKLKQLTPNNLSDNYAVLHQVVQSLVELENAKLQYQFNLKLQELQMSLGAKKKKEQTKPTTTQPKV